jgi:uncharacterized protein (DUF1330 family)
MSVSKQAAMTEGREPMKANHKLLCAVLIGVSVGITGGLAIAGEEANTAPGYVVAEVEVTDPAAMQSYAQKIEETLAPFNHHFVIRSSKFQALEGDAPKSRFVVIAFDSVEKARAWYDSPAYAAIRPIRQNAAKSRVFIVEGLAAH